MVGWIGVSETSVMVQLLAGQPTFIQFLKKARDAYRAGPVLKGDLPTGQRAMHNDLWQDMVPF